MRVVEKVMVEAEILMQAMMNPLLPMVEMMAAMKQMTEDKPETRLAA